MLVRCKGCFEQYDNKFEICPHCGYSEGEKAEQAFMLDPGTVVDDRYEIGNVISYGGFGIIYKCWDKKTNSVKAIKEHFPGQGGLVYRDPNSFLVKVSKGRESEFEVTKEVFLKEARTLAKFSSHPNICNVYNWAEDNNTAYFIMEYLHGMSLSDAVKKGSNISEKIAVKISLAILEALKAVHNEGILHRDIAPDNIFLTRDGKIKLIDFGAAKFDDTTIKVDAVKMGFAAPEQYDSTSKQGPYTDFYSLGATIYYMLSGIKPDESRNRLVEDTVKELKEVVPSISENLSNAVMKALAINPNLRFKSSEQFQEALTKGTIDGKRVKTPADEIREKKFKRIAIISSAVAALVVCASVFFGIILERNKTVNLQKAEINVWCISDSQDMETAISSLGNNFMLSNKNVTVNVIEVSPNNVYFKYERALEDGDLPNVIVSEYYNDIVKIDTNHNLGEDIVPEKYFKKINNVEISDCYLLKDYYSLVSDTKTVPLGINVPMIYVGLNRNGDVKSTQEILQTSNLSSLEQFAENKFFSSEDHSICVNSDYSKCYFEKIYGVLFSMHNTPAVASNFKDGKISLYLTSSNEHFDINNRSNIDSLFSGEELEFEDHSGNIVSSPIFSEKEKTPAELSYFSRMNSTSENEDNASIAFVRYMLSDSGQNNMFLQHHLKALPINRDTAEKMVNTIFTCFESVYKNIDNYEFSIIY